MKTQRGHGGHRSLRRERGQSTVEFALILPLVVVLVVTLIQITSIVIAQVAVTHTAREVARGLAVDPSADIGQLADESFFWGRDPPIATAVFMSSPSSDYETICVTVRYPITPIFGILTPILGSREVSAEAKIIAET